MSKELTKTQTTEVTTNVEFQDYEVSQNDIVIPKILLMQPISELVSQEKAKYGDFVNSLTNEVISDCIKGLKVIPLTFRKYHIVNKKGQDGKFKFWKIEDIKSAQDDAKPFLDSINGEIIERKITLEFCVLVPEVSPMPFMLQFKGMSIRTGKAFYTTSFAMARMAKKMPYETTFSITAKKTKNDKGNYAVLDFKALGKSTQDEIKDAEMWYGIMKTKKVIEQVEEEVQQDLAF